MYYLFFAHHNEAKPFIEAMNLKKDMSFHQLDLFRSKGVVLAVTGIGKMRAAIGVSLVCSYLRPQEHSVVANVGICGSPPTIPIGTLCFAHKVADEGSGRSYYPDISFKHNLKEETLLTVDKPHLGSAIDRDLVDMEGSGFFEGALKFFKQDRIVVLKVVSDHGINLDLSKQNVQRLIKDRLPEITALLSRYAEAQIDQKQFSHIYVEEAAEGYLYTEKILQKFPNATVIPVKHYKEIFNRSKQDWAKQKESMKLILSKKRDTFLYDGPDIAPSFGQARFKYTTPLLNCLYDCEYCFLQGMFPSANVVAFVNQEDFFKAVEDDIKSNGPLYLCNSYETDLLAFEGILPVGSEWIAFASSTKDLLLELRTKSANTKAFRDKEPNPNVILAWTLSPQEIAESVEHRTPSLNARLAAAKEAASLGWKVRICIDPLLGVDNWREIYSQFIVKLFEEIPPEKIYDIYVGTFRVNREYLKRMKESKPSSRLLQSDFVVKENIVGYDESFQQALQNHVYGQIVKQVPEQKVFIV